MNATDVLAMKRATDLTPEQFRVKHQGFEHDIRALLEIKHRVFLNARLVMTVCNGIVSTSYDLSDKQRAILDSCDLLIDRTWESYFPDHPRRKSGI